MIIFVITLAAVICSGVNVSQRNKFNKDYCSPQHTNTVNAIFSVLIFLSHAVSYIDMNGVLDKPYFMLRSFLGQLVVVTYLFFSGYGIMESIKKKGTPYVKSMPINRFFKLWYHFAIVILLFTVVQVGVFSREYTLSRWLLSFTGFKAIGNSNWYMFVTFAMYIIVIVSFLIFRKSNKIALGFVCLLSVGFVIFEYNAGLESRFYNTVLCFPLGMIFSMIKPYADKIFMKNDAYWFFGFSGCVIVFVYFSLNRSATFVHYVLFTFFAIAIILLFMMKVNIKSSVLDWFGKHIFSFFILQRIPMIILSNTGYIKNGYLFIIISFFGTVFLAVIFDAAMEKLDSIIFKKKIKAEEIKEKVIKG